MLRSLRNVLPAGNEARDIVDRLEDRDVGKAGARLSDLKGLERATVTQANNETFSKPALHGKASEKRDGTDSAWGCPDHIDPSLNEVGVGLTMPLSRHSMGTYPETSSHATCQGTFGRNRLSSLSQCGLILA